MIMSDNKSLLDKIKYNLKPNFMRHLIFFFYFDMGSRGKYREFLFIQFFLAERALLRKQVTAKASGFQTSFCLLYICYINLNRLGIKRWQMGQPVGQLSKAGSWGCWRPPALCFGASWTNTGHRVQLFRYSPTPLKMGLSPPPLFSLSERGRHSVIYLYP